jgi:hypothetical protein
MFIDSVKIYAKAGDGGNGCIALLREAFPLKVAPRGAMEAGEVTLFSKQATTLITLLHSITVREHVLKAAFLVWAKTKPEKAVQLSLSKSPAGRPFGGSLTLQHPKSKNLARKCLFFDPIKIRKKSRMMMRNCKKMKP